MAILFSSRRGYRPSGTKSFKSTSNQVRERQREREKERIAVEFEFDATRAKITRGYIRSKYIGILYRRIDNRFKKNNSEISLYLEASD